MRNILPTLLLIFTSIICYSIEELLFQIWDNDNKKDLID